MNTFLNSLLSDNGATSSKRFISIFSLILLTVFIIVSWAGVEVKEYQFWGLVGIVTGAQGMTFIKNNSGKP